MSEPSKAVFLSYASQDADAARRICQGLRQAGVEVWFDQSELRGGDAWDAKIRKQIKECALFVPLISANTQARLEGYFRLEWKLAEDRSHLMARGKPFILPVSIDSTTESDARVPDSFLAVQWSFAPAGEKAADLVATVANLARQIPAPSQLPSATAASIRKSSERAVAVLAFANLSRDPENEFFSDGISEELLNVLAKVPGLRVAARTSAFFFKGRNVPVPEIARVLAVTHVVEGSVRKSGNRVRITAQLINAADGFHLWSDTFDRELQDIFAVQDEIAGLIARNLQLRLGAAARTTQTVNPEAHRLVLEGRHFWLLRTDEGFSRAEAAYAQAIQLDPDFADAHAGLADVASVRGWYRSLSGANASADFVRAREAATIAMRLDPANATPHATLGAVSYNQWRFEEAEAAFQRALQLNPNYSHAHHWRAHLLVSQGRLDEGLAEMDKAARLDPLSVIVLVIHAVFLEFMGRDEETAAVCVRALALRKEVFVPLHATWALALWNLGRVAEALAAARIVTGDPTRQPRWWTDGNVVYVLREAGHEDEAIAHAERVLATMQPDNGTRASIFAGLGRIDEALLQLARFRPGAPSAVSETFCSVPWAAVRRDPRYAATLAKLGCLEEYERAQTMVMRAPVAPRVSR